MLSWLDWSSPRGFLCVKIHIGLELQVFFFLDQISKCNLVFKKASENQSFFKMVHDNYKELEKCFRVNSMVIPVD